MATVIPIRVTERAQALASEVLNIGDIAIDATAGKGRDTAYLAQTVGTTGWVHSFDIQPEAINSTRNLLEVCAHLNGTERLSPYSGAAPLAACAAPDLAEVKGQDHA